MVDWDKLNNLDPFSRMVELEKLNRKAKKKEKSDNNKQMGIFRCLKKSKN